ncbi:hypothetical protein F8M41_001784 [Gigaspora margarita]|uniref:Uncharacterized protein n=1 Tax=Gigaspora margarita TaxID=4874 RepID=A0A8H3XFC3_GIGMA|nr:hypothetical protein F8M41_001784 [Gigaspora margarita]
MFQGMKVTAKKSSKKDSSKKPNRKKASLEGTRVRTLAKIIENQGKILHQLQELNSKVRRIENQLKEIEEKMDNNFDFTNEKIFKEDTIKGAAKILIEKSIYPNEDQIKSELLKKIRALWGTLITKIKSSTFFIFGNLLELINNRASPETVLKWKRSEKTKACYQRLFDEVEDLKVTYMVKILTKIWPSGDGSEKNVAYAIAVAQAMLNLKYEKIMMSDTTIKHKIAKHIKGQETSEEEREDQKESPEDPKEAEQEPEDNNSNNVEKEPVRKNKNISKKSARPRVETSEIEREDQEELSEDSDKAENMPEDNDSTSSIASSSSSSDNDNDSKKETDKNDE